MNEQRFRELVQGRLIDSGQVREILGLRSAQGLYGRVAAGHLSGPVLSKGRGYALWDREQVEREEAVRKAKVSA